MTHSHHSAARRASSAGDDEAYIEQAVDEFRRILRTLRVVARRAELKTGLSAAQLFVLTAVSEVPGASINEIAEATMTDRSSVAAIVDRLVDGRYLSRKQSPVDRRRAEVTVTARGRRAVAENAPAPTTLLISALRTLPPEDLRALASGLGALTGAMGIAGEPAGMLFEDGAAAHGR